MDKTDAIAALTANGLVKMEGVRGDTHALNVGGSLTYITLRGDKWYGEGDIAHLPMMMGYSEEEVRKALTEMTCDRTLTECVVDMLKANRKGTTRGGDYGIGRREKVGEGRT